MSICRLRSAARLEAPDFDPWGGWLLEDFWGLEELPLYFREDSSVGIV